MFYPKFFWPKFKEIFIIFDKLFWPKFLDYIFNYKNSLTTNQMGFDTIEINIQGVPENLTHFVFGLLCFVYSLYGPTMSFHKCTALSILSTRFMWKWREASHFQEIWQDSLSFKKLAQDFNQLGENAELIVFVTSFTWKWHDSSSFLLAKQGSHLQGIEFLACMALKFQLVGCLWVVPWLQTCPTNFDISNKNGPCLRFSS